MRIEASAIARAASVESGTTISHVSAPKMRDELTMMPGRILFGSPEPGTAPRQSTIAISPAVIAANRISAQHRGRREKTRLDHRPSHHPFHANVHQRAKHSREFASCVCCMPTFPRYLAQGPMLQRRREWGPIRRGSSSPEQPSERRAFQSSYKKCNTNLNAELGLDSIFFPYLAS